MQRDLLLASAKEQANGFRYTIFSALFLPWILSLCCTALGITLQNFDLNLLCFAVNLLAISVIFRRFLLASFQEFDEKWVRIVVVSLLGFLVHHGIALVLRLLFTHFFPDFGNANDGTITSLARENYNLTALGTVVLVPLAEECMHRGAIFGGLYRKNKLLAYAVSTLVFALVHIDGYFGVMDGTILFLNFLQYIPAGLLLAAAYDISGSIFAPVFIHMAANFLGILSLR